MVGFAEDYPDGFRPGMHSHPRAQLVHAISGVMRIELENSSFVVPPTTALLLPADANHDILMEGPVQMRVLFLRKQAAAKVGDRSMVFYVSPLLRELILAACAEPLEWDLNGRGHHIAELALNEIARASSLPLELVLPSEPRLQRVARQIADNPSDDKSLEAWAEVACVSGRTLARLFRADTGMTFTQWRQHLRLTKALSALVSGSSPTQAAQIACFESIPAFGSAFRKAFGMTPGQARKLGQSN
ncbi:helix-turn-helix transcriptional regulator [Ruegeria sp. Ofav3-42]|uniref:AraC family transcriptional regulator n=1 Tax=Ruegeria sp. Ofav3-42 TaxID=2917759 RepID=UPI001EF62C51|nr:helix-turn-helix transcriptional regulator [Ruegeria sp. Ofav3-42]MCG7522513.1 helix-turn-helix transcriptional regulator [Ruegeria sp. Ofav3-42]